MELKTKDALKLSCLGVLTPQDLTVDHLNRVAYLAGAEKSPQRSEPGVD